MLTDKGTVLARTTVQHVTKDDAADPEIQEKIRDYHVSLVDALGEEDSTSDMDGLFGFTNDDELGIIDADEEEYQGLPDSPDIDEVVDNTDLRAQADTYDQFIGAKVSLPDEHGRTAMGRVVKRVRDNKGNAIGNETSNPLTNTSRYEVEFPDGHTEEL